MKTKKIAIVGSGISGLTCGYYLAKSGHDVTIYEKSDYIGGHTHTVDIEYRGEKAAIDTGFIVFNDRTYPLFIALLKELGVGYQPTQMSFSVRNDQADLEYNGHSLTSLFAQKFNLVRPGFWKMLKEITAFNSDVRRQARKQSAATIGDYLDSSGYSSFFKDNYLIPMVSAIWSMGLEDCSDFPLDFFVRFFENHGLLDLANRPQWYTVNGGSSSYIEPLTRQFAGAIHINTPVTSVSRTEDAVLVRTGNRSTAYDQVVFACHGDQALAVLDHASPIERDLLSSFSFTDNRVVLHTDTSLLPYRKAAWASWNYRVTDTSGQLPTLTYNMNILQRLQTAHTYLVTLNQKIDDDYVIDEFHYSHPVFNTAMIEAQKRWHEISGVDRIHYCGAYWFNGFHEDGVKSGLRVREMIEGM